MLIAFFIFLFNVERPATAQLAAQPVITNFWDGGLFDLFAGGAALLFMLFSLFYCLNACGWNYEAFRQYCSGDSLYNCGFFKNITNVLSDPANSWWQHTSNINIYKKYFWIDQLSDSAVPDFSQHAHCFYIFFFLFIFSSVLFYYTMLVDCCIILFFIICFFLLFTNYKDATTAACCCWYDTFQQHAAAVVQGCATSKITLFYCINAARLFMHFNAVWQSCAPAPSYTKVAALGIFIFTAPGCLFL